MATRAEIRTYAREQTLLDTSDVADSILDTYLDEAIAAVGTRFPWPFLQVSDTFETEIGLSHYAYPTGMVVVESIVRDGSKVRLRELSPVTVRQRYGDDPPTAQARAFYLWGGEIWLVETPPTVETYNVFYRRNPVLLAENSSEPEWDSQHHLFLAHHLIARMWDREEDPRMSQAADARFDQGVAAMAQFYLNRASDQPMVWGESADRSVGGYYGNTPWLDGV